MREFAALIRSVLLAPWYGARNLLEGSHTLACYYPNRLFRRCDLLCLWIYLLRDPFDICTRYLRHFPENAVQKVYGETFFSTLGKIARAVRLTSDDVVYELGCGRGRSVFWFHAFYHCRTVGIEINPVFVRQADRVRQRMDVAGVTFRCEDLLAADLSDATVIYLYGTCFSDDAVERLVEHFRHLRPGTRVATVSYPLTDYTDLPLFEREQEIAVRYPWGNTQVFIQKRTDFR